MKKLSNKITSLILIVIIIISFIQVFFIKYDVNASTSLSSSYTQYVTSGISSFPESYQKYLAYLKYLHPNWEFKAYYTGISWSEVTSSEAENKCLRNTIYKSSLVDPLVLCKCGQYGDSNYYCASADTVNYYLDPRNSLSEAMVFQFLDLSAGSEVSRDAVVSATSGTYLAEYVDYIMQAADEAGINPLHIVATIFQELGKSSTTPAAISGTYSGYEGYYNFFNYGASDGSGATARAMAKAQEMGWNSAYTALVEGAKTVLANNYISAGQTTKYFYKFDVVGNEILTEDMGRKTYSSSYFYSHQYMTNISDPSSQAGTLYTMYQDCSLLDESLTFIIPVYDDMPDSAVSMPTSLSSSDGELYYVSTLNNYTLNLRTSASSSSSSLGKLYRGTIVAVIGTSGTWSQIKVIAANSYSDNTWSGTPTTGWVSTEYLTKVGTEIDDYRNLVDMGSNTSGTIVSSDFEISGSYINMTPATTVSTITNLYSSAIVKDSSGNTLDSSALIGTTNIITIDGTSYTAVKYGDINGDGKAKASDYVFIKNYIMYGTSLTDVQMKAADVNKDGSIKASDYVLIKNYIMYGTSITL